MVAYNSFRNQISALLIISTLAFTYGCKKDNLLETSSVTSLSLKDGMNSAVLADGITADSYYLVNSLPAGYVQDGSVDYTSYVQAAVTKYSNVVFPGFPILVNNTGINIGSNKVITFQQGSQVLLLGSSDETNAIFKISGASNVTLYNPVIIGDRDTHIGTTGEWGMGIGLYGATDVTIYNAKISNCWGDGIYIGQTGGQVNCKNIVIKDAYLNRNRRDGISIIGVDSLLLDNVYAANTDGTLPMTGINIEPNNSYSEIKKVHINNARTENNGKNGIQVGIKMMVGATDKFVDISILNHVDIGSPRYPVKIMCNPGIEITGKVYGLIDIVNPSWQKTALETNQYLYLSTNQPDLKTAVTSPEIITTAGTTLSWADTYTTIMKASTGGSLTCVEGEPVVVPVTDTVVTSPTTTEPVVTSPTTTDTVTTSTTTTEPVITSPAPTEPVVTSPLPVVPVFAVNAGGNSFKAANGFTYMADKMFSGGRVSKSVKAVGKTTDDVLYQSERYGNFSYAIPVADGTYEITFRMAETLVKASGKRQFDILAENSLLVSNLDLFKEAGINNAFDLVRTISVTDGVLNLTFRTDINNATVSAFHIIKK